jgi:hypothetical protein
MVDVPDTLADDACDPEEVVRHIVDYTKPLLPESTTPQQWGKFADVVLAWVCRHREARA